MHKVIAIVLFIPVVITRFVVEGTISGAQAARSEYRALKRILTRKTYE